MTITQIPANDLIERDVYELHSRNLLVGVYNGHGGFIGIRTKFGDRYLFTEVLNDPPGRGTAVALRRLGRIEDDVACQEGWQGAKGRWRANAALFKALEQFERQEGVV